MQQPQPNKSKFMNTKHHLNHVTLALIVGSLALPLIAQAGQHPRYKLIDLGTFGGPSSILQNLQEIVNNRGTVIGVADTAVPDPFAPNCFGPSCYVQHAFQWQGGVLTDLGTLPGGDSSWASEISESGHIAGWAQNGLIDPLTGIPEIVAVVWQSGQIVNLGTFGGTQSIAVSINNKGQATGMAANAIRDPFSMACIFGGVCFGTQTRAFLWDNGVMHDLGTLGGPDSFGQYVNERGQVAGFSYTDSTPNDTTGTPTVHPFLWENGRMLDLGSLGGTFGAVNRLNNRGDVVGDMNLPGDEFSHPFLWARGTLTDLGTLGGDTGSPTDVNERGEVCGVADLPNGLHNAFLWKSGVMTDLGNLGRTSFAYSLNSKGQVVGASRVSSVPNRVSAFLWEKGGPMIDLNTLVPANSSLHLGFAYYINERGEIAGLGVPPGVAVDDVETQGHVFVLIPVGEK
jgi:probable HAF family extracellular repeat protein